MTIKTSHLRNCENTNRSKRVRCYRIMGFHCGNTAIYKLVSGEMRYQKIKRSINIHFTRNRYSLCCQTAIDITRHKSPEYPVGTAEECAAMIKEFLPIARTIIGLRNLKIITFGPRPQDLTLWSKIS